MKILYITTVGLTMGFFKSTIKNLIDDGHVVDIATNEDEYKVTNCFREWGCKVYQIDWSRLPLKKSNLKAIKQIRSVLEAGAYDIVHCHTPIAAVCTRLACRKVRKRGTRVFYTAHGFHFYKGAPLKNWLFYYPVEKFCAHFTDVLITINKEDYIFAQKHLNIKRIEYIAGVGIDLNRFRDVAIDKAKKREGLGVPEHAILLLSVGELNKNKNHETVIRAITNMNVHYVIAGEGCLREHLQSIIDELSLTERVKLIGYRSDVPELYQIADVYILPSFREGLNVSIMEAMASGLPCIASEIRGNRDLIDDNGGFLCETTDVTAFAKKINLLVNNVSLREEMGKNNRLAIRKFSSETVQKALYKIYEV